MATQRTSRAFKDISLSFIPHPITNDLTVLFNESAIARSVRNLVETIPAERFFNSTIGSDVGGSLFNNFDLGTSANIKAQITSTIQNYEPRVENLIVEVVPYLDSNYLDVTIIFDIVGQETPTQTVNFILEATR
jgi:phage baseplate assembly protein W